MPKNTNDPFSLSGFMDSFGETLPDAVRVRCVQEFTAGRADQIALWGSRDHAPEAVPPTVREEYRAHLEYRSLRDAA